MSKNTFTFGGLDSSTYGIWLSGEGTFAAPARDVKRVSVPGRNGDLIIDGGKWQNIDVTYPAYINRGFFGNFESFRSDICQKRGYQRLEDTYHPDEFRLASFTDGLSPNQFKFFYQSGKFDITFNCKPQRFLKSGEKPLQFLPPIIVANEMQTHYIPANGSVKYKVHTVDPVTVTVYGYDGDKTLVSTDQESCNDGDSKTVSFSNSEVYFVINVTGYDEADDTYLEIETKTLINSESYDIKAKMGRTITFDNPTGYAAKPLIEIFSPVSPLMRITNYVGGEKQDFYDFHVNDTSKSHYYIDCDMEYVYDDLKNNLTSYLYLTTAESQYGEGLVFPQLGAGTIELYSYYSTNDGLGLVNIYPNWWRL